MTSTNDDLLCAVCGRDDLDHVGLNHEFSTTGQLIPKVPTQPTQLKVVQTGDYLLRAVLLDKGLVTGEELNEMEVKLRAGVSTQSTDTSDGPIAAGDIANRGREAARRGLRGLATASPGTSLGSKSSSGTSKSKPKATDELPVDDNRSPLGTKLMDEGPGS